MAHISPSGRPTATTFRTLLYSVLENMTQDTTSLTSVHAHRARRALIDAMEDLRSEEFLWTEADSHLTSTAGSFKYDLTFLLSAAVRHPLKVWYTDSTTALLNPADDDGVERADHDLVIKEARDTTANQGTFSRWAWYKGDLYTNAPLDGTVKLYIKYVRTPVTFYYSHNGTTWTYTQFNGSSTESLPGQNIDSVIDNSGWMANAKQLIIARACRDLFLGAYQAKDPKKILADTWIARSNEEMDRLVMERERELGPKHLERYMTV